MGFPGGSVVKNPPANAGDVGLIPHLGRSPGGGNGNSLQCSYLVNAMDREPGGLQSSPQVAESQARRVTKQQSQKPII